MRCDDLGPDLLARALGQLAPDEAASIDAHVAACGSCAAEIARLGAEIRAARAAAPVPAVPASLRARLLAWVRDAEDDSLAARAAEASRACPEHHGTVADAGTHPHGANAAPGHAASCKPCADEARVLARLLAAHCAAVAPPERPTAELKERILSAARSSRIATAADDAADSSLHAVPPPPPAAPVIDLATARRRALLRAALVPLAAAASLLAAILLTPPAVGLHVQDDVGALFKPCPAARGTPDRWIDRGAGEVRFEPGDGVAAGDRPVEIRLRFGGRSAASPAAPEPGRGEVRLRLQPRAEIARTDDTCFELRSGRVAVHAGSLDSAVTFRLGANWAAVRGTAFDVAAVGSRLLVSVTNGSVEVGGRGVAAVTLGAGEDALVADGILLRRSADGRPAADAFLAPVAGLDVGAATFARGGPVEFVAQLGTGPAGAVTIPGFDDSDPRFLVRLKGPDGRTLDVKVQRSMLASPPSAEPLLRLEPGAPLRLRVRIPGLSLDPGTWQASLRVQAYGGRSDGAEWHGTAESPAVPFQVTPE